MHNGEGNKGLLGCVWLIGNVTASGDTDSFSSSLAVTWKA